MIKNKKILIVTECFYPEEFKINDIALSWKNKGYDSKYINDMCEKHGEKAFDIIKALKHEERIKEQHSKTEKRLNLLKSVSVH